MNIFDTFTLIITLINIVYCCILNFVFHSFIVGFFGKMSIVDLFTIIYANLKIKLLILLFGALEFEKKLKYFPKFGRLPECQRCFYKIMCAM